MTIKHVLLDAYNLVLQRNPKFVPAAIESIAYVTKQPWDACAFAFAESANYFRSMDPDGAFVCDPLEFACDVLIRLESHVNPHTLIGEFVSCGFLWKAKVTQGARTAIRYLNTKAISIGIAGNTNILPSQIIAYHCSLDGLSATDVDYQLLSNSDEHVQMPHDQVWLDAVEVAQMYQGKVQASDVLFVTTNAKYARAAERAGLQIAVISSPDEILPALQRRIEHTLSTPSEDKPNAILG